MGPVASELDQGFLVLADVTGYTGFLAGIELEHANGILTDLIQELLDGLTPPLELAGLEGDAVLVHGPTDVVTRGETLFEVIENTYAGFRKKREVMAARTTCPWRPFSSFSEEVRPRPGARALLSWRLDPSDGGTRLRLDVGLTAPLPGPVRRRICRVFAERGLHADLAALERAILEAA